MYPATAAEPGVGGASDGASSTGPEPAVFATPVLSVAGRVLTYEDLLVLSAAAGTLDSHLDGLSGASATAGPGSSAPPQQAVRLQAAAFRRRRHLESGEDLRSWLTERGLGLDDLQHYAEREARRAATGQGSDPVSKGPPVGRRELFAGLMFTGGWSEIAGEAVRLLAAERLAAELCLAPVPGGAPAIDKASEEERVAHRLQRAGLTSQRAGAAVEELGEMRSALFAVRRHIEMSGEPSRRAGERRIDWTRFTYEELRFPSPAAAREALSLAADGLSAAEIADRSGVCLTRHEDLREAMPDHVGASLDGAPIAQALGPFDAGGSCHVVLWLRERCRPEIADPEIAQRAVDELLEEWLENATSGLVNELAPL